MRLLLKTKLANFFFSIVFLVAIAGGSYLLFESRNLDVARKNVTIRISPSEMAAGQEFQVDITQTLILLCPYEVHWSLSRASDHVEVLSVIDDIRPAHTATGPNVAKSHHFLPPDVAPGQYVYTSKVTDLCNSGKSYITTLSAPFTVLGST